MQTRGEKKQTNKNCGTLLLLLLFTRVGQWDKKFPLGIVNPRIGDRRYIHARKAIPVRITHQPQRVLENRREVTGHTPALGLSVKIK